MARMYSRNKGKAKSRKPLNKTVPGWVKYSAKELEMLIVKYGKEGKSASQIGVLLRDEYGVPDAKTILKKSITTVLVEKKLAKSLPEDLLSLIQKAVDIQKHLEKNKQDKPAHRGMTLTRSKIKRLSDYYKKTSKIPADWKFEMSKAQLYLE